MESYQTPSRLGRYELLGKLANGGMAEIYLAILAGEAGFEKTVVVKRLLPELVASRAYVAMFLDEGRLVAKLDHPNICEVYELGRDGAEYFLAMPYLDGVPVTELIAQPRDPDRIAQLRVATGVIVQACAGLHHAHEVPGLQLVHRDVSPSNLFVTTAGVVKVLDFGIAKAQGTADTELGTVKGKSQYMAPEQVLGERVDRRCDVFALGIVLYELATHQRLFRRDSEYLSARAILEEPIPRADATDPQVPAALADVIGRALARDREARFPDARALAAAIEAAMAPHGIATAADIASALAARHGENLSAQRTRQRAIVEHARTSKDAVPTGAVVGTGVGAATSAAASSIPTTALTPTKTFPTTDVRPPDNGAWRFAAIAGAGVLGVAALVVGIRTCGGRNADDVAMAGSGASNPSGGSNPSGTSNPNGASNPPGTNRPESNTNGGSNPTGPSNPNGAASPNGTSNPSPGSNAPGSGSAHHHTTSGHREPGFVSIDSTPYATLTIDGTSAGITPLIHMSIAAGHHRIHAVLADGRSRDVDTDVPAGRSAPAIVLRW